MVKNSMAFPSGNGGANWGFGNFDGPSFLNTSNSGGANWGFGNFDRPSFLNTSNSGSGGFGVNSTGALGVSSSGGFGVNSTGAFGVSSSGGFGVNSGGFGVNSGRLGMNSGVLGVNSGGFGVNPLSTPSPSRSLFIPANTGNPFSLGGNAVATSPFSPIPSWQSPFGVQSRSPFGTTSTIPTDQPPFRSFGKPANSITTTPFGTMFSPPGNSASGFGQPSGSSSSVFGRNSTGSAPSDSTFPLFLSTQSSQKSTAVNPFADFRSFITPSTASQVQNTFSPFTSSGSHGTKAIPYAQTPEEGNVPFNVPARLVSISGMPYYKLKSHEELRLEDYLGKTVEVFPRETSIAPLQWSSTDNPERICSISALPINEDKSHEELRLEYLQSKGETEAKYKPNGDEKKVPLHQEIPGIYGSGSVLIPVENPRAWIVHPNEILSLEINLRKLSVSEQSRSKSETGGTHDETTQVQEKASSAAKVNISMNIKLDVEYPEKKNLNVLMIHPDNDCEESCISATALPKLRSPEYYVEPAIEDLAAKERKRPGFCGQVKDFVVGRHGYGSIKFLGETDVRNLNLESIVQFNMREVIVYADKKSKPPVGQGLNKPAEITLLNVKCVDKNTGKQYTDGPRVDNYRRLLMKTALENGAEFISFNPTKGEWRFKVEHF